MAEEDWRLSQEHDKKGKFCPLALDPNRVRELTSPADLKTLKEDRGTVVYPQFKHAVEPPADQAAADGTSQWLNSGMGFYTRGEKPKTEELLTCSQDLTDIVKICTEASRAGAEDLLWLSWVEAKSRLRRAPSRYSGLIAISAVGARKLLAHFTQWLEPGHFDTQLRWALTTNEDCRTVLSAGYLLPSLGHWSEHPTQNLGKVAKVREAYWHADFIAQGTRGPSEPPAARWDGKFTVERFREGGWKEAPLHPGIQLPEQEGESFLWWTAAITVAELPAGRLPTIRGRKRKGQSPQPALMIWVPKSGPGSVAHQFPPQVDDSEAEYGPIKVTAYQIIDEEEDTWTKTTASFQRRWRQAVNIFLRRSFTNDPNKAPFFMSYQPLPFLSCCTHDSKVFYCFIWLDVSCRIAHELPAMCRHITCFAFLFSGFQL